MARWLITVPTWGDRCVSAFLKFSLPSLLQAIEFAGTTAKFLIHTDDPDRFTEMAGLDVEYRPIINHGIAHEALSAGHRDAMASAGAGQYIALWCADMVMSVECFAATEKRFAEGKRIVMSAATRTYGGNPHPRLRSRTLLSWSMQHKHPIITECFWGEGKSGVPWAIYFEKDGNIVLRAFHLHPFAVVKDRDLSFGGVTIDFGLAKLFKPEEIHVVTDADEMSMVEMSPLMPRRFPLRAFPMNEDTVAGWAKRNTIDIHREFFRSSPITIAGNPNCGEQAVCDRILARI